MATSLQGTIRQKGHNQMGLKRSKSLKWEPKGSPVALMSQSLTDPGATNQPTDGKEASRLRTQEPTCLPLRGNHNDIHEPFHIRQYRLLAPA